MAKPVLLAVSLNVPPRWYVTSVLNAGPRAALVVQSRSVTWPNHVPTRPAWEAEFFDCAERFPPTVVRRKPARLSAARAGRPPNNFKVFLFMVFLLHAISSTSLTVFKILQFTVSSCWLSV